MTYDVASEDLTAGSDGYAERSVEAGERTAKRRSIWRVSIGSLLLFAAGAMVGFAPMRAWVFLRDEPKAVMISAVVLEADAQDVAGIREALKAYAEDSQSRNLDPVTVLESRPGTKTLAEPTLQTMVGESVTFHSGGEIFVASGGAGSEIRRFGFEATFCPEIRRSGNVELSYRISHRPLVTQNDEGVIEIDEMSIESKVVLKADEWQAIEWNDRAASNADGGRVRWIFLRVHPED